MSTHSVTRAVPCRCGASGTEHIGAATNLERARLRVNISFECTACGARSEADAGELDDDLRDAFCASEGRWAARIDDLGERRLDVMSAVKTLCGLTPIETIQSMRSSEPIAIGALVEVELVREQLAALGAAVVL